MFAEERGRRNRLPVFEVLLGKVDRSVIREMLVNPDVQARK